MIAWLLWVARRVTIGIFVWIGASVAVGVLASRIPTRWLDRDSPITRIRAFERDGTLYRHRLRIHEWKDRLPESNSLGGDGRASKSKVANRRDVQQLVIETRRAEYVHWTLVLFGLTFRRWNPRWLAIIHVIVGAGFNAPFIAVQRYNRLRARRSVRPGRSHECPS